MFWRIYCNEILCEIASVKVGNFKTHVVIVVIFAFVNVQKRVKFDFLNLCSFSNYKFDTRTFKYLLLHRRENY